MFKDQVCKEYKTGKYTKTELEEKYGLGHGRVLYWLEELGYGQQQSATFEAMKEIKSINTISSSSDSSSSELQLLRQELEQVRLELAAHKLMIDIAERELKIDIRKKCSTK